ncbi:MAG: ABC transporter substrate-binding protein [Spirochaetes bacterium]|nr:ABC transporter substrate-binding protein [Spirochaetota bacterium]
MDKKTKTVVIISIFFLFLCASCKQDNIDRKIASKNSFARNFSYKDHQDYIRVNISAGGIEYIWYLYRSEKPIAVNKKRAGRSRIIQYVKIPVQRIISLSAENIFFLESLDSLDKLKAIDLARNSSNRQVRELVRGGAVAQVGEGRDIDVEMVYLINPDLIITSWTGGDYDSSGLLLRHGFPVAVTAGWLEEHPLGRAEWLVFLSLFLDMAEQGKRIFDDLVLRYNALAESILADNAAAVVPKPVVFLNMMQGGSWNMPGGRSFFATFLRDAGASYPWADVRRRGSLFLDFEKVFTVANNADVWLVNTHGIRTLDDILSRDRRYSLFRAFQTGRVYNNDLMDDGAGNPFWDEGTAHPDRILSDLISIIHNSEADKNFFRRVE